MPRLVILLLLAAAGPTLAGQVRIEGARFEQQPAGWRISVTLRHSDAGWSHYADAWRVVDEAGRVIATRTLYHPHDDEQPFTRHLSGVALPSGRHVFYIEAHDTVHGWSRQRLRVDLDRARGPGFEVRRLD